MTQKLNERQESLLEDIRQIDPRLAVLIAGRVHNGADFDEEIDALLAAVIEEGQRRERLAKEVSDAR